MTTVYQERGGRAEGRVTVSSVQGRDDALAQLVIELADEEDMTLTFEQEGRAETLLVALSGGRVFIGLEGPKGVAQFARQADDRLSVVMNIGGQTTSLESRYVWDTRSAAEAVSKWLSGSSGERLGMWEWQ